MEVIIQWLLRIKATLSQVLGHFLASPVQPSLDGPFGTVEHFSNFFDR